MSWQAIEAVQDHSKIDDHTALSIMYVIARYADATGAVGSGGRATSPSIDTIAAKSRCHRNTVLNWLPKLEATGELTIERLGSGRGSWNRYSINLPMPDENNGTSKDVPLSKDMVQEMVQKLGVMVQDAVAEMKVMVHDMVHNGTSHVVLDTNNTDKEKNIYTPPDTKEIAKIKTALAQVVKTPQWEKTKEEYDEAAVLLMGWDATPETIANFAKWWDVNRWHPGLPELSTLVKEYRNFLAGVKAGNARMNGKVVDTPDLIQAWQRVKHAVTQNRIGDLTQEEKQAVRAAGGVHTIKNLPSDDRVIMNKFFQALQGAKC